MKNPLQVLALLALLTTSYSSAKASPLSAVGPTAEVPREFTVASLDIRPDAPYLLGASSTDVPAVDVPTREAGFAEFFSFSPPTHAPEPSSLFLLGTGLVVAAGVVMRRGRQEKSKT